MSEMSEDEAVKLIEESLQEVRVGCRPILTPLEKLIIIGTWQGHRFQEIAAAAKNDVTYVKTVGSKLWADLTTALGEKVSKPHLKTVLELQDRALKKEKEVEKNPRKKTLSLPESASTVSPRPSAVGDFLPLPPQVFGRTEEIQALQKSFQTSTLRCIFLTGVVGVGKTTVAAKFAATATGFDRVIWLSLHDKTKLDTLIRDVLRHLGVRAEPNDQSSVERLLQCLKVARHLLIFDGIELLLENSEYQSFFRQIIQGHKSCLILISDEPSDWVELWYQKRLPLLITKIEPLDLGSSLQLLKAEGIFDRTDQENIVRRYGSSPFILKLISKTVHNLFGGNVSEFLEVVTTAYTSDMEGLYRYRFDRLSITEKEILVQLSRSAESSATFLELKEALSRQAVSTSAELLLAGLDSLKRHSLIDIDQVTVNSKKSTVYRLPPMVRKHVLKVLN